MEQEKTKVVFKVWTDDEKLAGDIFGGDIIAIFPGIYFDNKKEFFMSYQHIGQHGACHPDLLKNFKDASYKEYEELLKELESIGYDNLLVLNEYC